MPWKQCTHKKCQGDGTFMKYVKNDRGHGKHWFRVTCPRCKGDGGWNT